MAECQDFVLPKKEILDDPDYEYDYFDDIKDPFTVLDDSEDEKKYSNLDKTAENELKNDHASVAKNENKQLDYSSDTPNDEIFTLIEDNTEIKMEDIDNQMHCDQRIFSEPGNQIQIYGMDHKHQCNFCKEEFTCIKKLKAHMSQIHPLKLCKICNKSFPPYYFKRHQQVHNKTKIYKCYHCGKGYVFETSLRTHHLTIHGEVNPYKCDECGQTFSEKLNLRVHLREAHKKAEIPVIRSEKYQEPDKDLWTKYEHWILLWVIEYARVRYIKRAERYSEWQRIFFHHCPSKKGIHPYKLRWRRNNMMRRETLFTSSDIQEMKIKVNYMVKERKCPLSEPLQMPI